MLATVTPNGTSESFEYHHPDRLGTKLVTNPRTGTSFEQATLPFGTLLNSETTGATNKRFTSYERSAVSGLDYAVNRTYDSGQGRFTQVDPIGMQAASLAAPQTLNMYSYCGNDPINRSDPSGLFWGFFKSIGKAVWGAVKKIFYAAIKAAVSAVTAYVLSGFNPAKFFSTFVKQFVANLGVSFAKDALTPGWKSKHNPKGDEMKLMFNRATIMSRADLFNLINTSLDTFGIER